MNADEDLYVNNIWLYKRINGNELHENKLNENKVVKLKGELCAVR
jgi:hypothetical protein